MKPVIPRFCGCRISCPELMLRMDAWPWLRERAMGLLSAQPQLFAHLLAVHLGERSLGDFLFRDVRPALGFQAFGMLKRGH